MKKLVIIGHLLAAASGQLVEGLFCGIENCYDVLGVPLESTNREIHKAYKKFAVDLHPDRNANASPSEREETEVKFSRIVTAYETLKNEREDYDHFLANPEDAYYKYWQYYRRKLVAPNIDMRIVILFLLGCVSALQWTGWNTSYKQALEYMYHVDKYRMAAKREAEARGLLGDKKANRGKTQMQVKEEEKVIIMQIIEEKVDIRGGYQKPVLTDLFAVKLFLYPYALYKLCRYHIRWYVKFTLGGQEYGEEEKLILIKSNLSSLWESNSQWEEILDEKKQTFLDRELWIKENSENYIKEEGEKERQERADSNRWKRHRRFMKTEASRRQITFEDD